MLFTPYASKETDAAGIPRFEDDSYLRCRMDVAEYPDDSRSPGHKGVVVDLVTGTSWDVFGAPCDIKGCFCAVRVVPSALN